MRTEEQLRQTLATLAEQAPPPKGVLDRLAAQTGGTPQNPRRVALLLVAVVVLVLALVLPTVLTDQTAEPASTRVRGNWNLVHRVEPAAGSMVRDQVVLADSELSTIAFTNEDVSDCSVEVHGPQGPPIPTATSDDVPVEVGGRDGFYRDLPRSTPLDVSNPRRGGLYWTTSNGGWLLVMCGAGLERDRELAERVVLEPVTVRLPFQLLSLPNGYRVLSVLPERSSEGSAARETGIVLEPINPGARPLIAIWATIDGAPAEADRAGLEKDTVAGFPAVFDVTKRSLCLDVQDARVCVFEAPRDAAAAAEQSSAPWPAERRTLLVEIAEQLQLVRNPSDHATWFEADQALPA